jgi:transcriptional regulator with XRE-family HTH domain
MKSHNQMVAEWINDPSFKKEYDALEPEFVLFDELLKARCRAGLTQSAVAERMGTRTPAVARLESGGGSKKHSPSITTLRKYAEAVGCSLEIKLIPRRASAANKFPKLTTNIAL